MGLGANPAALSAGSRPMVGRRRQGGGGVVLVQRERGPLATLVPETSPPPKTPCSERRCSPSRWSGNACAADAACQGPVLELLVCALGGASVAFKLDARFWPQCFVAGMLDKRASGRRAHGERRLCRARG
jgi:hypothetical protein